MITVGPTRNTIAMAASAPNTARSDNASQSVEYLGATIALALASEQAQNRDRGKHGDHEDDRDRRRERPVVGADRLLIDVQRHIDQPRAAYQRLGHERRHAGRIGENTAGD